MKRASGLGITIAVILCFLASAKLSADGRWKLDGNGGCYWDENDAGADQCGRWKIGGDAGCYWDAMDSGPDQCSLPMSTSELPSYIALADDINSSISGTTLEDAEAAINLAYSYGVVDSPSDDLSEAQFYASNPTHAITCAKKDEILASLNKAMYASGTAAGGLAVAAGLVGWFYPPAGIGLGIGGGAFTLLTAGVAYARNTVSSMACTP